MPGELAGEHAAGDDLAAVDEHVLDAPRLGVEALAAPGQVVARQRSGPLPTGRGRTRRGRRASPRRRGRGRAARRGARARRSSWRTASSSVSSPRSRTDSPSTHGRCSWRGTSGRGARRRRSRRARRGRRCHTPRAHLPALVGPSERRHQRREHHRERQALGQHDVDQHVDGIGAALGGDLGDRPADAGSRLRRARSAISSRSDWSMRAEPRRAASAHAVAQLVAGSRGRRPPPAFGVGQRRRPRASRAWSSRIRPARMRMRSGSVSATTCAPCSVARSHDVSCCS